jgi:hypothetical protein
MVAASAATGFRTWLQTHHFGWLTPKRMRSLTISAMVAAGLVSTVGISGSSAPVAHAATHHTGAQHAVAAR